MSSLFKPATLCFLVLPFTFATTYADMASRQFGKVEVSEILFGNGPNMLTSDAIEPLDLVLGQTGLEANLRTFFLGGPFEGVKGQIFVQATAVLVPESKAMARFEYDFSLSQGGVLRLLRFFMQFDGTGSLLLVRDGSPVYASLGEELIVRDFTLLPGFYELTVDASAAVADRVVGFNASQVDFALLFNAVPEPNTGVLASALLLITSVGTRHPCAK